LVSFSKTKKEDEEEEEDRLETNLNEEVVGGSSTKERFLFVLCDNFVALM